jgi:hypothetical protein
MDCREICPACGFSLGFKLWDGDLASFEICPCCFMQFGYDDFAGGDALRREQMYSEWRHRWIAEGHPWRGAATPPAGWDARKQLSDNLGLN